MVAIVRLCFSEGTTMEREFIRLFFELPSGRQWLGFACLLLMGVVLTLQPPPLVVGLPLMAVVVAEVLFFLYAEASPTIRLAGHLVALGLVVMQMVGAAMADPLLSSAHFAAFTSACLLFSAEVKLLLSSPMMAKVAPAAQKLDADRHEQLLVLSSQLAVLSNMPDYPHVREAATGHYGAISAMLAGRVSYDGVRVRGVKAFLALHDALLDHYRSQQQRA
jgi:hypothetical protein